MKVPDARRCLLSLLKDREKLSFQGVTSQELTMEDDLIIDDAKKSDTGIYRCTGTNDVGSVHQEISINIRCKTPWFLVLKKLPIVGI